MKRFVYYSNCVGWPRNDVHKPGGLIDMIDNAQDITRHTFVGHVDQKDLQMSEKMLGYATHHTKGLTMAKDWHVSYHKSKLHGHTVYYFRQSAIEYVFVKP
jgi:hypothetical protein